MTPPAARPGAHGRSRAAAPGAGATRDVERYLQALVGREPGRALIEVRWRHDGGMRRAFLPHTDTQAAARRILRRARTTDVYVGATPRQRPGGGKDAIDRVWALWADLDNPQARAALEQLPVAPAILIASGTSGHLHAYWPLAAPVTVAAAEAANRRLAAHIGADQGAPTNAATILRPPGTYSHKTQPPTPVVLERLDPATTTIEAATAGLARDPAPPHPPRPGRPSATPSTRPGPGRDPLRDLDPAHYVAVLTGQTVGRSRKISCPWHTDSTPSLHVYENPGNGWHCFGCGRHGHTAYDLASQLWGLDTRGRDFIELRERLQELLLPGHTPPPGSSRRDPPPRTGAATNPAAPGARRASAARREATPLARREDGQATPDISDTERAYRHIIDRSRQQRFASCFADWSEGRWDAAITPLLERQEITYTFRGVAEDPTSTGGWVLGPRFHARIPDALAPHRSLLGAERSETLAAMAATAGWRVARLPRDELLAERDRAAPAWARLDRAGAREALALEHDREHAHTRTQVAEAAAAALRERATEATGSVERGVLEQAARVQQRVAANDRRDVDRLARAEQQLHDRGRHPDDWLERHGRQAATWIAAERELATRRECAAAPLVDRAINDAPAHVREQIGDPPDRAAPQRSAWVNLARRLERDRLIAQAEAADRSDTARDAGREHDLERQVAALRAAVGLIPQTRHHEHDVALER